jgi:hypothetical protein
MGLLETVKTYLNVNWEEGDSQLTLMIEGGVSYLSRKTGAAIDFNEDKDARALLCDYVRYARSNALDEFEQNYIHEIISLREKYQVRNEEVSEND